MRFGQLALIPALAFVGCQTISPDDAGPTRVIHVASDYKSEGDCLYTKVENYWHYGPTRNVDLVNKTDLPSLGETRIQEADPEGYGITRLGWQIRVKRVSDKSSECYDIRGSQGNFWRSGDVV